MDMYQKREMRKKQKNEPNKNGSDKIVVNCDVGINGNHPENAEK